MLLLCEDTYSYLHYLLGHSNKALLCCTWYLTGGPFFSGLAISYYVVQANVKSGQITTHYNCHNQVPRTQAFPGSECQRYNGITVHPVHPSIAHPSRTTLLHDQKGTLRPGLSSARALSCWVFFFWPFAGAVLDCARCCAVLCCACAEHTRPGPLRLSLWIVVPF